MRTTTIVIGLLLFLLGPLSLVQNQMHPKPGAIIAAVLGLILLACGFASTTVKSTKIAAHIAVVVAFLGLVGSLFGKSGFAIPGWISALSGKNPDPQPAFSQMILFLLCGFFVVRSVLWFLGNRSTRKAA